METTAEADTNPEDGGDDSRADRTSGSRLGEMRVEGTRREPDEAAEARGLRLQNGRAVGMGGEIGPR
jgi:hypothetical protein